MRTLSVIVPAYNEEVTLRDFLPRLIEHCCARRYQLIVVNDGSCDRTGAILEEAAARGDLCALHHKVNRGYGAAIKTGIFAATTDLVITIDADGQHNLDDVDRLFRKCCDTDADMIIGSRRGQTPDSRYRSVGKSLIRWFAKLLMPLDVHDINSGMKIYRTDLANRYLTLCPDSMPYSDIITLAFVHRRHRVFEEPIRVKERLAGHSAIGARTAFETIMEILHILVLFNPMRIFLPISAASLIVGVLWGLPIALDGRGVSVGAMLAVVTGLIFFFLGLIAEQLSWIRKFPTEFLGAERVAGICGTPSGRQRLPPRGEAGSDGRPPS